MTEIFEKIGMIAAFVLPLWNIPLIVNMIKRKSSKDVSLLWAIGVWGCFVLMAPSGFRSAEPVWRIFNITNLVFFSAVVVTTLRYRKGP